MSPAEVDQALRTAIANQQAGQRAQAESLCQQVLAQNPNHDVALQLSGVMAMQDRRLDVAVEYLRRATVLQPEMPEYHGNLGNALKDQGNLEEAVVCYRRVLQLKPNFAEAYNNLGVALQSQGKTKDAIHCYQQALQLKPGYANAYLNLGFALQKQGKTEESISACRRALELKPDFAEAYVNLAIALKDQGSLDEAVACCRRALELRPDYADAYYNLGIVLQEQDRLDEAVDCYHHALLHKPDLAVAYLNLGNVLKDRGKLDEAIGYCRKGLELNPENADAHCNLGMALQVQEKLEEAATCYRQALQRKPDFAEAYLNLGNVLKEQGKYGEAVECCRKALAIKPAFIDAHVNLGNALRELGRLDEAIASHRRALALKPDHSEAHANLGVALMSQGNFESSAGHAEAPACNAKHTDGQEQALVALATEKRLADAETHFNEAVRLSPQSGDAHFNRSMLLLLRGDFAGGWADYEWRWQAKQAFAARRGFVQPHWDGSALAGRTILLHAEQGLGDTVQFVRYAPLIAKAGGDVIVECQPPLKRLFENCLRPIRFINRGEPLPTFDIHCPLMCLPRVVRTTLENIPNQVPYLNAAPEAIAHWHGKVAPIGGRLKVGLVWAGNKGHKNDRNRSIALDVLAPLAQLTNIAFFSLQKRESAHLRSPRTEHLQLIDWTNQLGDLADTAALIANLDLVIAVDTAVAHLAGALGKTVWTLLPMMPDWRWLLEREDSPWYPTMRLFRQTRSGDWPSVVGRVAEALREWSDRVPAADDLHFVSAYHAAIAEANDRTATAVTGTDFISEKNRSADRGLPPGSGLAQAQFNLGLKLKSEGKLDEAVACYRRALDLNPHFAEAHNNLGVALKAQGKLDEAVACYRRALDIVPDFADGYNNLGNALRAQGNLEEAVHCARRALELRPNFAAGYHTLGAVLHDQGRFEEAISCLRRSLALSPNQASTHNSLGLALDRQGWFEEAQTHYERAVQLRPDYGDAHWNLSLLLLRRGDYVRGWREYEWRWQSNDYSSGFRQFSQPQWDGSPLAGRTILLHAEQGLGDTLQFIRYAPLVAGCGGQVIVECPAPLKKLFEGSLRSIRFVLRGQPLPAFDVHCPLLSLPQRCGTTLINLPRQVPYLRADAEASASWRGKLAEQPGCLKVGLVWAGNKGYRNDRNRSIPFAQLAPLWTAPGVSFYSLQKGEPATQAAECPAGMKWIDWTGELNDFADTAALIANLDLVISVDTAVAHLTGALGKPVWTLLPLIPDWRWLLKRDDSPWYPSMRLFRQSTAGEWSSVVTRMADALNQPANRRDFRKEED